MRHYRGTSGLRVDNYHQLMRVTFWAIPLITQLLTALALTHDRGGHHNFTTILFL